MMSHTYHSKLHNEIHFNQLTLLKAATAVLRLNLALEKVRTALIQKSWVQGPQ
jgi:hypothetical protein